MRYPSIVLATALAFGAMSAAATAQTGSGPAAAKPAGAKAPFGCDARAPAVCHFRIYFARGSREVFLAAGMKQAIPGVEIGRDSYCVEMNKKPVPKCPRKTVNARYNN